MKTEDKMILQKNSPINDAIEAVFRSCFDKIAGL